MFCTVVVFPLGTLLSRCSVTRIITVNQTVCVTVQQRLHQKPHILEWLSSLCVLRVWWLDQTSAFEGRPMHFSQFWGARCKVQIRYWLVTGTTYYTCISHLLVSCTGLQNIMHCIIICMRTDLNALYWFVNGETARYAMCSVYWKIQSGWPQSLGQMSF